MEGYLTLSEAAEEIGRKPVTLRAYAAPKSRYHPKLRTEIHGNVRWVRRDDFEAWKVEWQKKARPSNK